MDVPKNAMRLRVFVGEGPRYHTHSFNESITLRACGQHLTGAIVLRGSVRFRRSSRLRTPETLRLSGDLPVLDGAVTGGLAALERIQGLVRDGAKVGWASARSRREGESACAA